MPNRTRAMSHNDEPRFMKFNPEINTGTIIQIVVVLASAAAIYSGIRADQVQVKADVEMVRAASLADRTQTKETLEDIKRDVRELQKSNNDIKESLAILRGRAAEPGGRK